MSFRLPPYFRERNGTSKLSALSHPVFWLVLGIKIGLLPFIEPSVITNNYLLWKLLGQGGLFAHVLILLADIGIFIILTRWLQGITERALWLYWCSPIVFVICYVGGFLDIIPIAFLIAFLYFVFKHRHIPAFILLGVALATKAGLVLLLPFIVVYLVKEQQSVLRALSYMILAGATSFLLVFSHLKDPVFWHMLQAGGGTLGSLSIDFGGTVAYVLPLVYLGLVISSIGFQRFNRDIFLMFLAFALGLVTLLIAPEAQWYSWILPFFCYFYAKEERVHIFPFVLLNVAFFAYFAVPQFIQNEILKNATFTLLQGALLYTIFGIYRIGIQQALRYKIFYKSFLIGIAGDSGSGKSTLTTLITQAFGPTNTLQVAGDDMHKWERGDPNWTRLTHLNPAANRLHADMEQLMHLKNNKNIMRTLYDHATGHFTKPERMKPKKIIVFQGLHSLYLSHARASLDFKIFLAPDESLRRKWKIERDLKERGHSQEKVLKQLDDRSADSLHYIEQQKSYADVVISFKESGQAHLICDNSIDIEPFTQALFEYTSMTITHEHAEAKQHIMLAGGASTENIDALAYRLIPQLWDIERTPKWQSGLNGILQVFLAYTIWYKVKLEYDALEQ